jgi:hypothetical protein
MNVDIFQLLINQATEPTGVDGLAGTYSELNPHKLIELVVSHCSECVRDVLRDPKSTLGYQDANMIQQRMKEFFGVEW